MPSREESSTSTTELREEKTMFLHSDPQIQLDLYHQRSDELMRQAAEYRRARSVHGRHRRFGRWPRRGEAGGTAHESGTS
jgi:hypothetical protein